jgi:hypothetical protein
MYTWLKKNGYSENIANELAPMLSNNYNSAFKKGFEVGLRNTIISVGNVLPSIGNEVLLFVNTRNGIKRTLGYRSKDADDPENIKGWVMDYHLDGNVIAWSYLPEYL